MEKKNQLKNHYIYKLVSPDTDKCYIGSAKNLAGRFTQHKKDFDSFSKTQKNDCYCSSLEIMKYRDVAIVELEHIVNGSQRYILERESYHIKNTPNTVNKKIPIKDDYEYIECACGGCCRRVRHIIKRHVSGRIHKTKMQKKGFLMNSIDGKNEINYKDFPVRGKTKQGQECLSSEESATPFPEGQERTVAEKIQECQNQLKETREWLENFKKQL